MAELLQKYHRSLDTEFQGMKSCDVRKYMLEKDSWDMERMLVYLLRLIDVEQSKIIRLDPDEQLALVAQYLFRLNRFLCRDVAGPDDLGLRGLVERGDVSVCTSEPLRNHYESRVFEKELAVVEPCMTGSQSAEK